MSKFTILGTIEYAAGTRDQLLAALTAHRARSLAEEPGTLEFEILVPREQQSMIYIYETYVDEEAFEAHLNGASFAHIIEGAGGIITELTTSRVTTYNPRTEALV
jgi:(4S)-4-hydroxy-5-phosphonooxypentane-2,3-dione isomerase